MHIFVHSLHCLTQTAAEEVSMFSSDIISQLYLPNELYEVLFINLL
jgi:hypothetical protein